MSAPTQETLHVRVNETLAVAMRAAARARGMSIAELTRKALRREVGLDGEPAQVHVVDGTDAGRVLFSIGVPEVARSVRSLALTPRRRP